ncbi:HAD family hydrolase [Herbiconiux sp. L3-i23]|uniref:HAD family hydrolase n=1 Tax=Herbiconiux sp. L3-i23 TaxID=2905871 RepID=UPI002065F2EA|nr:HAD family hydrolase [Herbiconiux sp. L3-i23]BDI21321.1 haloacid dehalogenase [Herbiconiux sp. L3-i23]
MTVPADERWLIALDIDGTVVHENGRLSDEVRDQVQRLSTAGHEVMLATGRSVASTLPVLDQLGIAPEYVVCSNGAITVRRDALAPMGYRREYVETFDPASVLTTIRSHLEGARYAVEDETGFYRYTEPFPDSVLGLGSEQVSFDELLGTRATRVVVISPDHAVEEFLGVVERMGLHRVSYAVGWTAWLDIAPDGVNKATAMERVRSILGVPRDRVVAVGDGRNDIELLEWAGESGRGVAMGQAPAEVIEAASETTGTVAEDGLATALSAVPA